MNNQYKFSNDTREYLSCFYSILDEMINNMENAVLSDSISHNFIVQMIPHHQAAIEMSCNILQYTKSTPLRNIATNIIEMQTNSIDNMQRAIEHCSTFTDTCRDLSLYQRQFEIIAHIMFEEMDTAMINNNADADFMRQMIPHHQGAIRMSENALHFDICPELKPILHSIILSQTRGIHQMQRLLRYTC